MELINRILDLPEVKLFLDYWWLWIGIVVILLVIDKLFGNKW